MIDTLARHAAPILLTLLILIMVAAAWTDRVHDLDHVALKGRRICFVAIGALMVLMVWVAS